MGGPEAPGAAGEAGISMNRLTYSNLSRIQHKYVNALARNGLGATTYPWADDWPTIVVIQANWLTDERLLAMRNLGKGGLAWIRTALYNQ